MPILPENRGARCVAKLAVRARGIVIKCNTKCVIQIRVLEILLDKLSLNFFNFPRHLSDFKFGNCSPKRPRNQALHSSHRLPFHLLENSRYLFPKIVYLFFSSVYF